MHGGQALSALGTEGVGKAGAQQDRTGQGEGDGHRQAESLHWSLRTDRSMTDRRGEAGTVGSLSDLHSTPLPPWNRKKQL